MSFKHVLKYDELNKYILKTDLRYKKILTFLSGKIMQIYRFKRGLKLSCQEFLIGSYNNIV